ncbi:MAG TPA: alpha/beta hydrolase [Pseudonocardiaceae bacterium]|jgi:pimeloyl-ACP methyl ester carboxylesterase|nr:alpha/beta hydrolase [Pseudonocardiaceae bacterium]
MASTVTAHGQRLSYVDHGGSGPVVVLLHSFLMDGGMFAPQVDALGTRFRRITVDTRGHGDTPAEAPFDYWDVARDVLDLLDELGIERFAALGCSQGGFVALRLALLAPERVSALVVLGSSAAVENPDIGAAYRQLAANWVKEGPTDPIVDMVAAICLGSMPAEEWKAKWRARPVDTVEVLIGALVERASVLERLREIDAPALVLHGSADLAYPVDRGRELAEGLPNAAPLVVVEGGAHFLSLTDAAEVNTHLLPFLLANV